MDSTTKPQEWNWNTNEWDGDHTPTASELATLKIYRTDAVVLSDSRGGPPNLPEERAKIGSCPSKASLQRLVFVLNNCDRPMTSMLTMTMTPQVSSDHSVDTHKKALLAALQRLRRSSGVRQYCWVREYQGNESIHWHLFTDASVGKPGEVNRGLSESWSNWFASYYLERNATQESYRKMAYGNGSDFIGCCRFEQLKTDAAGLYASKEGAKRFQKQAPAKWEHGGAWWRASRNIECTALGLVNVDYQSLTGCKIKVDGYELDVPFKYQYSMGLKFANSPDILPIESNQSLAATGSWD